MVGHFLRPPTGHPLHQSELLNSFSLSKGETPEDLDAVGLGSNFEQKNLDGKGNQRLDSH